VPDSSDASAIFAILESYKNVVNPEFGYAIARRLAYGDPIPDGTIISRWIPILFQNKPLSTGFEFITLLERSIKQDTWSAVLQLFEYLTRSYLHLRKRISWKDDDSDKKPTADVELIFYGNYSLLNKIWEENLKLKLPELAFRLWPILIQNLSYAYQLLNSWGKADSTGDPLSWHRSAIGPHDQDRHPDNQDILINAARDCMEWALENVPHVGLAWIEVLSVMDPLILRRLAVHGIAFAPHLSANDKIKWMLDKDFVITPGMKHEIFQLFKNAYPDADSALRMILIKTIMPLALKM
jgi:hypothetical protein